KITENTLRYQHGWDALKNLISKDFIGYWKLDNSNVIFYSDLEFKAKKNVQRIE
ncbi:hypothetical protein V5O48_015416, partial [Marasmius crinis-equi]